MFDEGVLGLSHHLGAAQVMHLSWILTLTPVHLGQLWARTEILSSKIRKNEWTVMIMVQWSWNYDDCWLPEDTDRVSSNAPRAETSQPVHTQQSPPQLFTVRLLDYEYFRTPAPQMIVRSLAAGDLRETHIFDVPIQQIVVFVQESWNKTGWVFHCNGWACTYILLNFVMVTCLQITSYTKSLTHGHYAVLCPYQQIVTIISFTLMVTTVTPRTKETPKQ